MLIRRKRRAVPTLNTTSTADISFMLLIFFLVTTSMDVDRGIARRLPPLDKTEDVRPLDIARSRLMQIEVLAGGQVRVDGQPVPVKGLRKRIVAFVRQVRDQHLISVRTADDASYDTYFALQGELTAAYAMVRDEEAVRRFGHVMALCTPAERQAVTDACPPHVAENYDHVQSGPEAQEARKGGGR